MPFLFVDMNLTFKYNRVNYDFVLKLWAKFDYQSSIAVRFITGFGSHQGGGSGYFVKVCGDPDMAQLRIIFN